MGKESGSEIKLTHYQVDRFMRDHGFAFHRFYPENSRVMSPLMVGGSPYAGFSQLVWADAIFIRDVTKPEALDDRQLLAMATILHDCYGSVDVALRLLAEHDRRNGGTLSGDYLAAISDAG